MINLKTLGVSLKDIPTILLGVFCLGISSCEPWDLAPDNFPAAVTLPAIESDDNPTNIEVSGEIIGLLTGTSVQEHGHVWSSTNPQPTLTDNTGDTQLGRQSNGSFQSKIEGLTPGRRIFYRSYLIFEQEIIYGEVLQYQTSPLQFQLNIDRIVDTMRIKERSQLKFSTLVTNLPLQVNITQYGLTWSTEEQPMVSTDEFTIDGLNLPNNESQFAFQSTLFDLAPDRYYARPYLQVADTTYYGETFCFSLGDFWVQEGIGFPGLNECGQTAFGINGKGYYGNGQYSVGGTSSIADCNDLWTYTPESGRWNKLPSLIPLPMNDPKVFVLDEQVYMGLGYRRDPSQDRDPYEDDLYAYDPNSDQWTKWRDIASFPSAREGIIAFVIDNVIYAGSGTELDGINGPDIDHLDFWKYDPTVNEWLRLQDLPFGHRKFGLSFAIKNKGYWMDRDEFWEYHPSDDSWKLNPNTLEEPGTYFTWLEFIVDDKAYFRADNKMWAYDSAKAEWTQRTPAPSWGTSFTVGAVAYTANSEGVWAYYPLKECD